MSYEQGYYTVLRCAGLLEKEANYISRGIKYFGDSFNALKKAPSEIRNYRRAGGAKGQEMLKNVEAGDAQLSRAMDYYTDTRDFDAVRRMQNSARHSENLVNKTRADVERAGRIGDWAKSTLPAVGLVTGGGAAAAGGTAYALGDADTYSNKMRRSSNDLLGTNFKTQSRIGNLLS